MTEPSVETAEGRAELRRSGYWTDYWFKAALARIDVLEAQLAGARAAERERCALICDLNGNVHSANAIRALRDPGAGRAAPAAGER